jgi:outer membrane protein assembly factor BamB
VFSYPGGAPSGWFPTPGVSAGAQIYLYNQNDTGPLDSAAVVVNGTSLTYTKDGSGPIKAPFVFEGIPLYYSVAHYVSELTLNQSDAINVSVTIDGTTYSASATGFSTLPSILVPSPNATWAADATNTISWSSSPNTGDQIALGIYDNAGKPVWPASDSNQMVTLPTTQTSYTIPGTMVSVGNRLLVVAVAADVPIAGAIPGSALHVTVSSYEPITVVPPRIPFTTPTSLTISPSTVTLGIAKSIQLSVQGTFPDNSTVDLTGDATWSSSDTSKATVTSSGLVTGVANGSAIVTADFRGVQATQKAMVFQPNPSPVPPLSQSVAYQIDYRHSGEATVGGNGPSFPQAAQWTTTLNGRSSYPLIAEGKVFVETRAADGVTFSLYALDETNGTVLWGPILLAGQGGHAYDHGKVFVATFNATVFAFDAKSGTTLWSRKLPGQTFSTAAPTAINGMVYASSDDGMLYGLDEANGDVLWTATIAGGGESSPAVSADGVFASYQCNTYDFDPVTGAPIWHTGQCAGSGALTPALYGDRLYVRDTNDYIDKIFDSHTGAQTGTFNSTTIPAVSGASAYYLNIDTSTLTAVDAATQNVRWTFTGDGALQIAPIVIDSVVVIGSGTGMVYALNAATGATVWVGQAGDSIWRIDERNENLLIGLGAGDGYLVVPASNKVTAWRIAP